MQSLIGGQAALNTCPCVKDPRWSRYSRSFPALPAECPRLSRARMRGPHTQQSQLLERLSIAVRFEYGVQRAAGVTRGRLPGLPPCDSLRSSVFSSSRVPDVRRCGACEGGGRDNGTWADH